MISSNFNTGSGILETTVKGVVTVDDFTKYIIALSKDNSLPKVLKIFTDASDAIFSKDTNPEDLYKIVEANAVSLAQRKMICDAFMVSGQFETALGQLYTKVSKSNNYFFKIFSTKEAAINWLKSF